jgi:ESCRT-II complex subunit VPS36
MPPPLGTLTSPPQSPRSQHLSPPTAQVVSDGLFPCPRCTFLNHPALTACEICGEPLISPNLPPILASAEAMDRGVSPAPQPIPNTDERNYVRLSFRSGGEKIFLERLKSAISKQSWTTSRTNEFQTKELLPPKTIGINGLERASAAIRLQNDAVLQSSFQDLEALMARAKDLVALAEQLASKLASLPQSSTIDARLALRESTELLGLNTPIVTKEITGGQDAYWSELARQIAEFLTSTTGGNNSILKREGGIIPLIDLFAIYNRARGVCTNTFSYCTDYSVGDSNRSSKSMFHVSKITITCASKNI